MRTGDAAVVDDEGCETAWLLAAVICYEFFSSSCAVIVVMVVVGFKGRGSDVAVTNNCVTVT